MSIEVLTPEQTRDLVGKINANEIGRIAQAVWSVLDTDRSVYVGDPLSDRQIAAIRQRIKRAGGRMYMKRVIRDGVEGVVLTARSVPA
jgi:phage major head subunit gpT-like protein